MPPKKASATKAKAIPATAAADRPRRAAAKDAPAPTPAKKAPAKKAAAKAATTTTATPKKRGRPAKTEQAEEEPEPPKKRGRPSKAAVEEQTDATAEPPKKRERPAKAAAAVKDAPAVSKNGIAPPKKRGRPPKGGETTKIAEDDPAAAEQLEDELVDATEVDKADELDEAEEDAEPSKRAPPAKKGKGRGRPRKQVLKEDVADADTDAGAAVDGADAVVVNEDEEVEMEAEGTTQYWLMKAEQVGHEETLQDGGLFNTKFTIDDLLAKAGPEPWDGVRNSTACKNMREMKAGDLAFFYASGAKGKTVQPGITGIMEVVKEHEPDLSAFDEKLPGYVQNAKMRGTKEKPRWSLVHVEFRKKLSKPVTLKELQKFKHDSGVLANMQEFTAARLSVSKVSPAEWKFIVDNLIEGYEHEALPTAAKNSEEVAMTDVPTINGAAAGANAIPTSETAAPSIEVNDTSRASMKKPSSRPTSRAPFRAASRASSKVPSRPVSQGDLAPPRAQSRGRNRTPASRANSVKPMQGLTEEMETVEE